MYATYSNNWILPRARFRKNYRQGNGQPFDGTWFINEWGDKQFIKINYDRIHATDNFYKKMDAKFDSPCEIIKSYPDFPFPELLCDGIKQGEEVIFHTTSSNAIPKNSKGAYHTNCLATVQNLSMANTIAVLSSDWDKSQSDLMDKVEEKARRDESSIPDSWDDELPSLDD